jgi:hypothetical protein
MKNSLPIPVPLSLSVPFPWDACVLSGTQLQMLIFYTFFTLFVHKYKCIMDNILCLASPSVCVYVCARTNKWLYLSNSWSSFHIRIYRY